MKKLFNLFAVVFFVSFLIACSGNSSNLASPAIVAENFVKYVKECDTANLIKIIDLGDSELSLEEKEKQLHGLVNYLLSGECTIEKQQASKYSKAVKTTLEEEGNIAQVVLRFEDSNGRERNKGITLINRNGQWKVLLD